MYSYILIILAILLLIILLCYLVYKGIQRRYTEPALKVVLAFLASITILITAGIIFSVFFETLLFFEKVSPIEFFFSTKWAPQTSIRIDQIASEGSFGLLPVLWGTVFITIIAMFFSIPLGLFTAIYLSVYANNKIRNLLKPILEILAGIPTVVYGFIAAIQIGPILHEFGQFLGLQSSSESALAAGSVMGVMIIPLISSLSDDAISAVPQTLRDASLGLGSTRNEMIRKVLIPAALPGISGGILLAVSRAIGETMIVVMAAGLFAKLTLNPFDSVTTVSVQIVSLLVGDQEFDSAKTLSAYALGATLFVLTLLLNIWAYRIVKKYRELYE